jgi:hypothetical protein
MVVNYYVLIYVSASLTESLSLTLTILGAALWLEAYRNNERLWPCLSAAW